MNEKVRYTKRRKYLSVAPNIDNRKVSFCLWIVVEVSSKSFNSLKMGRVRTKRAGKRPHVQSC